MKENKRQSSAVLVTRVEVIVNIGGPSSLELWFEALHLEAFKQCQLRRGRKQQQEIESLGCEWVAIPRSGEEMPGHGPAKRTVDL